MSQVATTKYFHYPQHHLIKYLNFTTRQMFSHISSKVRVWSMISVAGKKDHKSMAWKNYLWYLECKQLYTQSWLQSCLKFYEAEWMSLRKKIKENWNCTLTTTCIQLWVGKCLLVIASHLTYLSSKHDKKLTKHGGSKTGIDNFWFLNNLCYIKWIFLSFVQPLDFFIKTECDSAEKVKFITWQ